MGIQDCKDVATFIAKNRNFVNNLETADLLSTRNYQSVIKTLIYAITQIYSNLAYFVSIFSKFSANILKEYIGAVK